jgi:hypothetical protein
MEKAKRKGIQREENLPKGTPETAVPATPWMITSTKRMQTKAKASQLKAESMSWAKDAARLKVSPPDKLSQPFPKS